MNTKINSSAFMILCRYEHICAYVYLNEVCTLFLLLLLVLLLLLLLFLHPQELLRVMPFYGLTSPAGAMARGCRRYRGSGTNMSEIHELRVRDRDLDLDCAGKIEESSKVSDRRRGCSGTVTGCQKPKERDEKEI